MPLSLLMIKALTCGFTSGGRAAPHGQPDVSVLVRTARAAQPSSMIVFKLSGIGSRGDRCPGPLRIPGSARVQGCLWLPQAADCCCRCRHGCRQRHLGRHQPGGRRSSRRSLMDASLVAASNLSSVWRSSSCRSMLTSLGPMLAAISWRRYLAQRNIPARKPISTPKKISTVTTACLSRKTSRPVSFSSRLKARSQPARWQIAGKQPAQGMVDKIVTSTCSLPCALCTAQCVGCRHATWQVASRLPGRRQAR